MLLIESIKEFNIGTAQMETTLSIVCVAYQEFIKEAQHKFSSIDEIIP